VASASNPEQPTSPSSSASDVERQLELTEELDPELVEPPAPEEADDGEIFPDEEDDQVIP
jgi:hypothetical protein